MNNCCHSPDENQPSCHTNSKQPDWLFWLSLISLCCPVLLYTQVELPAVIETFLKAQLGIIKQMWVGMAIGVLTVGLMNLVPSRVIVNTLGRDTNLLSLVRATIAGMLLDLCNHGILLIASKLYKSGVRYSQVMAFLIASPWNSLSLTIVMFALLGWEWTLAFVVLSLVIALLTGLICQILEKKGLLPENPNSTQTENSLPFKEHFQTIKQQRGLIKAVVFDGIKDSKTVMRWLLFGMILAALMQTFISDANLQNWFGANTQGLAMTLLFATILEVCSEGLLPIAADLLSRAAAPGNAFAFLMAGVSTDYTEILTLKETTGQWILAFLLPLITLPQIIFFALILNQI